MLMLAEVFKLNLQGETNKRDGHSERPNFRSFKRLLSIQDRLSFLKDDFRLEFRCLFHNSEGRLPRQSTGNNGAGTDNPLGYTILMHMLVTKNQ